VIEPSGQITVQRAITAAVLDGGSLIRQSPGELDFTIRVMRRGQLLGRLAWQLREAGLLESLPRVAQDALSGALAITESRARVAVWELNRIAWALADEPAVPLVAIKGCAYLLAGLPNAPGRLFADVDLLAPESSLGGIESRLIARDWRATELTPYDENYYRVWTHELPPFTHAEREVEVDLHHNIVMRTARVRPDAGLLIAQSRALPNSRFRVLAPIDMVLHAMTHLFHGSEMEDSIRELVDIHDLLRHFGNSEPGFWDGFWRRARELDLTRPAFYGLRYARRVLGTPVPDTLISASAVDAPPSWIVALMDRLVPAALFPRHPDRSPRGAGLARSLLYVRSHWVRMPALMLAKHLAYKLYVRNWPQTADTH
jgi:hypothetical protein